jgi:primosomal protein N' (replication factor Y) (superfamily II helicase)
MTPAAVWRVVLDMPLRRPFDYLPPTEEPRYPLRPGVRVRVPFGRQRLIGVVTDAASGSELPAERLKPILEVLDEKPVLDDAMLALLTWASDYYHHPIGEVLSAALPKALRAGAPAFALRERWPRASRAGRPGSAGSSHSSSRLRGLTPTRFPL